MLSPTSWGDQWDAGPGWRGLVSCCWSLTSHQCWGWAWVPGEAGALLQWIGDQGARRPLSWVEEHEVRVMWHEREWIYRRMAETDLFWPGSCWALLATVCLVSCSPGLLLSPPQTWSLQYCLCHSWSLYLHHDHWCVVWEHCESGPHCASVSMKLRSEWADGGEQWILALWGATWHHCRPVTSDWSRVEHWSPGEIIATYQRQV